MKLSMDEAFEEFVDASWDKMLNRSQKKRFVRSTLRDLLRDMTADELEKIKSAIRMSDSK